MCRLLPPPQAAWDHGGTYLGRSYENVYGVLTSDFDQTNSQYIQRSNSFCGKQSEQEWPTCTDMIDCFERTKVHAR